MKLLTQRIDAVAKLLAAFSAVLVSVWGLWQTALWQKFLELATVEHWWLIERVSITYLVGLATVLVLAWLWGIFPFAQILKNYRQNKSLFVAKITLTGVISLLPCIALVVFISSFETQSIGAEALFPQVSSGAAIRTYATNGEARYVFESMREPTGPDGYAKIWFQAYGTDESYSCGWVYFMERGRDLGRFSSLRFFIKGQSGGEIIGLKAKDARGVEVSLLLDGNYFADNVITTKWQQVNVPLDHFPRVEFDFMDNFSLFASGEISGTRPQVVFVGGFELR